ncbi:MAG: hypothetical protein KatS3mg053_2074 [Candidatus Roseilinea sp.]|nr:MAG: hypothetical protein KatS3mg053_2074 [Candidatus Roseilinea sp.]
MLRKIDDKLHEFADRVFEALGYHRHPPPVRLTRIVIVRVPEHQRPAQMSLAQVPPLACSRACSLLAASSDVATRFTA